MHFKEMFDLSHKVAIVTGGGRGIGKFIATGLAEAGSSLVIASRKVEECRKTAQELETLGVKVLALKLDMTSRQEIESLVDTAMQAFGGVDILVNNAGTTWGAPTLDYPLEKWDKVFEVNVKGVWILSQRVANIMKDHGGGKIINISSVFGARGSGEEVHPAVAYNASKAALNLLTMNLAVKLAKYRIYVNAIMPGFFRTDMMEYIFKPERQPALEALLREIPLARVAEADDIKALAVFLASKASDYITGAVIPVDGGFLAK